MSYDKTCIYLFHRNGKGDSLMTSTDFENISMIILRISQYFALELYEGEPCLHGFSELFVLFDPKLSSDSDKRRIAEVVSHELAHQWFGNLVTPSWWNDLWLKEGFATYIEYIGTDHVEPEWNILDLFVINELQKVFKLDALNISHEISIPLDNPNQINQIFDCIVGVCM